MKAYIVIEWNGEIHEDFRVQNVAVYLNKELAESKVNKFNESRDLKENPNILSKQDWLVSMHDEEDYDQYLYRMDVEWEFSEQQKRQHVQEIEITE
jgi:hypothetical protein